MGILFRRLFAYLMNGPPGLPSSLRLEWQLVGVRWLGILLAISGITLANLIDSQRIAAAVVVWLAIAYNLSIPWIISRNPALIWDGYVTSVGEIALAIAMMASLGNGFASPFGLFLFVITMAIAMRFGYRQSLLAAGVFIGANVAEYLLGAIPIDDSFVFRSLFLVLTAILVSGLKKQADRANEDLRRAYAQLSDAHRELLSVGEMKTNFVANVSHELRTPLTSIRSYSEMLLTYDDPAVRREFVGIILEESERLTRLIDDVLDIAKIEAGKMIWSIAPIDLTDLLQKLGRTYRPLVEQCHLTFGLEIEPGLPVVNADLDRIEQVCSNLLSNALKFTHAGTISLKAIRSAGEVQLMVVDSGIGISPADQELIFEKFQQVGPTLTSKPHGTGLGLAICREIVTQHGGRIWVSSKPRMGSTFTVALPIAVRADYPNLVPV